MLIIAPLQTVIITYTFQSTKDQDMVNKTIFQCFVQIDRFIIHLRSYIIWICQNCIILFNISHPNTLKVKSTGAIYEQRG
jgi:hypothetical protein